MFKICFSAVALVVLGSAAQADVGFRTVGIGGEGPRPLNVALWYPAKGGAPAAFGGCASAGRSFAWLWRHLAQSQLACGRACR